MEKNGNGIEDGLGRCRQEGVKGIGREDGLELKTLNPLFHDEIKKTKLNAGVNVFTEHRGHY